jgi:hypothetical protein
MRPYKPIIHILVILFLFNFVSVLAAPIPVQEAREACADVADEGGGMEIMSGKRSDSQVEKVQDSWSGDSQGSMESIPLSSPSPSKPEAASPFFYEFNMAPNTEIGPATPSPGEISPARTEQPKPEPQSVLGKLASKSKGIWRKVVRVFKSLFSELVKNPHLQL